MSETTKRSGSMVLDRKAPAITPTPIHDSANQLTDFDLCLALTQKAINDQLAVAWKAWKDRKQIGDTIDLPPVPASGARSRYGLTAQLEPLAIDLNLKDAKLAQVLVTLRLESGDVRYYDEDAGTDFTYPIKNWSISFVTSLDKKPVDLKLLEQIDPVVKGRVAEAIKKSGLPDSVFSIEYLFMKFTEVDLLLTDNKNVDIPKDVPELARVKALSSLNKLLQGQMGDFMLGVVVRRNAAQATPTFALTDFVFDVHANQQAPAAATLSYLGMLSRRPLPKETDKARVALKNDWVSPGLIDGTHGPVAGIMAIRLAKLMDEYLVPKFEKALGVKAVADGTSRRFAHAKASEQTVDDIVHRTFEHKQGYVLTLEPVKGKNQLKVTGKVYCEAEYKEKDHLFGETLGWLEVNGEQVLNGTVTLTAHGIGKDFALDTDLDFAFSPYDTTKKEAGGTCLITDIFTKIPKWMGLTDGSLIDWLADIVKDVGKGLGGHLKGQLNKIDMDLSNHDFIPPGGGVFTFQNVHFSDKTADLIFEVIYQAP